MNQVEERRPRSGSSSEQVHSSGDDDFSQTSVTTPPDGDSVTSRRRDFESTGDHTRPDPRVNGDYNLRAYDVAALIINKMIGTGIFTGPYIVLRYTQSKPMAIGLWVLGFSYTVLSMIMYLEYSRKLPFTGGELVYLDDLFPKKKLLAYTLYSFYFVLVYTTCTNAMQFGAQVLLAAKPIVEPIDVAAKVASFVGALKTTAGNFGDVIEAADSIRNATDPNDLNSLDGRLVRFLAVVVITAVCMLLYVSSQNSRLLNRATATTKVLLLVVISCFGAAYIHQNSKHDLDSWKPRGSSNWVPAFITVLYSFHGWENATLVVGEIPTFRVLKRGFILGVTTVGALYLLVACLFCVAFDWEADDGGPMVNYTAAYLSIAGKKGIGGISEGARIATAVIIAISAVGSMISVAYAGVRVKQSIGWAGILPWSWFWRRSGPLRAKLNWRNGQRGEIDLVVDQDVFGHTGSPEGGVVLHWIVSMIYICIVAPWRSLEDAISFTGNLIVYGHFFAQAFVAAGFVWFDPHDAPSQSLGYPIPGWLADNEAPSWWMRKQCDRNSSVRKRILNSRGQGILGPVVLAFSLAVVFSGISTEQNYVDLGITLGILVLSMIYWVLFIQEESADKIYNWFGYKVQHKRHGVDDRDDAIRQCAWCWKDSGEGHRHTTNSYLTFNEVTRKGDERLLQTRVTHAIFGDKSH